MGRGGCAPRSNRADSAAASAGGCILDCYYPSGCNAFILNCPPEGCEVRCLPGACLGMQINCSSGPCKYTGGAPTINCNDSCDCTP